MEAKPPPPVAAILATDSVPEPPLEDGKPEEKPSDPLVRPEELLEHLGLQPEVAAQGVVTIVPDPGVDEAVADARTFTGPPPDRTQGNPIDASELAETYPHAVISAIAAAACSSAGATRGSTSSVDLESEAHSTNASGPDLVEDLDDFDDVDWENGHSLSSNS